MELLGVLLTNSGRARESGALLRRASSSATRRLYGADSTRLCNSLQLNGTLRSFLGQRVEAERLLHEACDCYDRLVGDGDANFCSR